MRPSTETGSAYGIPYSMYLFINWCRKVNLLKLYTLYSAAECFMHLKRTAVRRRINKDKSEYHKKVEENIGVRKTVIT